MKKNGIQATAREMVTSGSVNVYRARYRFSPEWDGMTKRYVFRAGTGKAVSAEPEGDGVCVIPWEVLAKPGLRLYAGVYGTADGEVVLPTVWAYLGTILEGACTGEDGREPTPDVYEQLLKALEGKADKLGLDGQKLSLLSGERELSSVVISGGGGGGTDDHRALSHREDADQHPVEAISGLDEISNLEILEMWNGGI